MPKHKLIADRTGELTLSLCPLAPIDTMKIDDKQQSAKRDIKSLDPNEGRYTGTYRRIGSDKLERSDGEITLTIRKRFGTITSTSSPVFLVDDNPDVGYLSNLYTDEFDDRVYRYKIRLEDTEKETYQIFVIRPVSNGLKPKGGGADV
jgi:hypothetical protein